MRRSRTQRSCQGLRALLSATRCGPEAESSGLRACFHLPEALWLRGRLPAAAHSGVTTRHTALAKTADAGAIEAAKRYVEALFDLALAANALDGVSSDLVAFRTAFENADLQRAAASPRVDPAERVAALLAVAEALKVSALTRKFIGVVAQNGRAELIPLFADEFERRLAEHRGERRVEIIAAQPIEAAQLQSLTASLSAALGKQVRPSVRIDERLIGGFIARAGSRQFDASIRSKLDALAVQLTSQR